MVAVRIVPCQARIEIPLDVRERVARAVDGVDYEIRLEETVCLVGESGCGKTVSALSILGLIPQPPGEIAGGSIVFKNKELLGLADEDMQQIRGYIASVSTDTRAMSSSVLAMNDQMAKMNGSMINIDQQLSAMNTSMDNLNTQVTGMHGNMMYLNRSVGVMTHDMGAMSQSVSPMMSGMRKFVRTPPTSMAIFDWRGKPS